MISRRLFGAGLCATLAGCATYHETGSADDLADIPIGYTPPPNSDEAGLWLITEKAEKKLRPAPSRIRNKALEQLVADIVCRLSGKRCPDFRSYIMRVPEFNATCAPNGMIQVYSGLLLRVTNESQLAAILGHEIGHYIRRHSLARLRNTREADDFMAGLDYQMSGPWSGLIRDVTQDLRDYGVSSFSRDNERESDALGLGLMADAGYDPFECAEVWRNIVGETEAADRKEKFYLFASTHPSSKERIENLTKLAEARGRPRTPPPDRLDATIRPLRRSFMADEVNQGHFKSTQKVLATLIENGNDPAGALFYTGELYRRRNKDGDEAQALGFYYRACEEANPPPEAFRGVAMIHWRNNDKEQAREYFRRYLSAAPAASDAAMIHKYLSGA